MPVSDRPRIIVVAPHVTTDPGRASFYNRDASAAYHGIGFVPPPGRFKKVFGYAATALALRRLVKRVRPELVVFESPRVGLPLAALARLLGRREKMVIWSFNILRPYTGFRRWMARYALGAVDCVIVYSRHEQEMYSRQFGMPGSKVRFKHLSGPYLEDPRYAALLKGAKKPYVVSPGYSGRDFRLLAEVAASAPQLEFVVLAYPSAVGDVVFPSNVRLRHGIPETEYCRYIAEAEVCFVPVGNHQTANGHIAIIQAMSLRTLLFTNATPGTRDYLQDGRNCILFDARSAADVGDRLLEICQNPQRHAGIVDQAYRDALERSSVQSDVDALHDLLRTARSLRASGEATGSGLPATPAA